MDRRTPTVADVVRRAVEICDPESVDPDLGRLQEQLEDDEPADPDELITLAVRAQWHGQPPAFVADWLSLR